MASTVFCIVSMVLLSTQTHALLYSKRSSPTGDESLSPKGSESGTRLSEIESKYLTLLEDALTGTLTDEAGSCIGESEGGCSKTKPYDPDLRERGQDWPPYGVTMVGHMRMRNLRMAIEDVVKNNVPGDFVELGAWRGGASIWAKALFNVQGQKDRKVHMFDAWDGIPLYEGAQSYIAVQQEAVMHNFAKYNMLDENVLFHKGLFTDTVPDFATANPDVNFAVLRIDANFYDSYQDALYYFYPKVPVGGYIIFDDVYQDPVRCGGAWRDFKNANGVPEDLIRIDDASGYFKKTVDVPIDRSRMKPPQDTNIKM